MRLSPESCRGGPPGASWPEVPALGRCVCRATADCRKNWRVASSPMHKRHMVSLRVVIGNPVTKESDIDAVISDQLQIIQSRR